MLKEKPLVNFDEDLTQPCDSNPDFWPELLCERETHYVSQNDCNFLVRSVPGCNVAQWLTQPDERIPVLKPMHVTGREADTSFLVTRMPHGAMPLARFLEEETGAEVQLREALVVLLAHLHLSGFHFQIGAQPEIVVLIKEKGLHAYLANPESGVLEEEVTDLNRAMDLAAFTQFLEVVFAGVRPSTDLNSMAEPVEFVNGFLTSYQRLWTSINEHNLFMDEDVALRTRVTPFSELPRAEKEQISADLELRVSTFKGDYHSVMLKMLTGLEVAGGKGRKLLRDIYRYRAWLEFSSGKSWSGFNAAQKWMKEVYLPAIEVLQGLTSVPAL